MTSPDSKTWIRLPSAAELVRSEPRLARYRPTFATVDLGRLAGNFRALCDRVGDDVSVIPVVKADAYGHGAVAVARRLTEAGAGSFAVALAEEGIELRAGGVEAPILLLGVLAAGQIDLALRWNLTPAVFERSLLDRLEEAGRSRGRRVAVHLKIDTGMARIGFPESEWSALVAFLSQSHGLEVAGVFTNFASADDPSDAATARQVDRLDDFLGRLSRAGLGPGIVHASNSAGILSHPAGWKRAVRPGLTIYGLHPGELVSRAAIRPVLALETEVIQMKSVAAGQSVGYGGSWIAGRDSRVATLPAGYDDGFPRALSGRGTVLFDAGSGKVAGRVSMDMTMVDVTDLPGIDVGSAATLIGERGGVSVTASDIAGACGTIAYEILCGIGRRVPRVYVEDGEVLGYRSPFPEFATEDDDR